MRGSKAKAEVAALEGLLSSPDTQECKRIFQESIGCEFDSLQAIDDCTNINKPEVPQSRNFQPPPTSGPLVSEIEIFSCSQQVGLFTKAQAVLKHPSRSPDLSRASALDSGRADSGFFDPRGDSRSEQISVHTAQLSALHGSTEKANLSCTYGIATIACSRARKMEELISPLDGSDGSNLSPTQENDPAVYIRLQQELLAFPPDSQASSQARTGATPNLIINNGSAPSAQDTGVTYAVHDTGHLTLDYQPPPSNPLHDSFDDDEVEVEVGDISSRRFKPQLFDDELLQLQTPAQAKVVIGNPGTVMRPSQMFAETQPSPGSRDRHLLPPSSSRPSPDLFNHYKSPKHLTSSPLARRLGRLQAQETAEFDVSSSPEPLQPEGDGNGNVGTRPPHSDREDTFANTRSESLISTNLMRQNLPEPFDVYTTRKESQERRRQHATVLDDADQSSDDGFSDDEAELNRRAKRRKEEAAKELAVVSSSRRGSAGTDFVEVPSTNTGRRRSVAEEYEAQCLGFDTRDTQPDDTILDSQSAPTGGTIPSADESTRERNNGQLRQSNSYASHHQDSSQEYSAHSGKTANESSEQLPALELNEGSEATESDQEDSKSPISQHLSQVPSNIAALRTPATHKQPVYVDGDTVVPETSPSEPHLQRYGDIVSQTPPVLSAEDIDDAFNPFTQDAEFDSLIQSPSPRRRRSLRNARPRVSTGDAKLKPDFEPFQGRRAAEISETNASSSMAKELDSGPAIGVTSNGTAPNSSEYVTAPTGLTLENFTPKVQWSLTANSVSAPIQIQNAKDLPVDVVQDLKTSPSTALVGSEVTVSKLNEQLNSADMEGLPASLNSLAQENANENDLRCHEESVVGNVEEMVGIGSPEPKPAKKTRVSSRSSKSNFGKTMDIIPTSLEAEASELLPNRLRSATQLRGSSRSLRRLLEDNAVAPSTPVPTKTGPTPAVQKITRSSRRSSANSSEKAQSIEPEAYITPTLSTRRRTMSNQPTELGLFDNMAFSVTYSAHREDEKQQVLGLIRKNGGRVLEKGFDELFDVNSLQTGTVTRNGEADNLHDGSTLTLIAAARGIGFACVIADEHSRRVKFMQALALGLPCISGFWIEHCVARKEILDWEQYHLAAGESSFLGGAVRSRNLPSYSASTANFANQFELRPKFMTGKSILLITGKGRVEERRKPYFFLAQALGARRVKHVPNNQEARRFLLEAESNGEEWNWVYVDENEDEAEKAIFGVGAVTQRKRKREVSSDGENPAPAPKKVRIVSDEYIIQSLILGKFLEE